MTLFALTYIVQSSDLERLDNLNLKIRRINPADARRIKRQFVFRLNFVSFAHVKKQQKEV